MIHAPPETRQRTALRPPTDGTPSRFPAARLTPARPVHRAHREANGPWWFSSDGSGRFDLPDPEGTCYLAGTPAAALRETLGLLVRSGVVPAEEVASRVVSTLTVPAPQRLASTTATAAAANHGLTREIHTVTPYSIPQAWARRWREGGFDGVRYTGRFSTDNRYCYAIFGPAGPRPSARVVDRVPARDVADAAGLRIVDRPRRVTITTPPTARRTTTPDA